MNARDRVFATLNHQPTDRTPLDCWLYQKQFVEMLEAEYGPREQFMDEFNLDLAVGFVPYPNQLGSKVEVHELVDIPFDDPKDHKWLAYSDWSYDFAGYNIVDAVRIHQPKRAVVAHVWGMVEGTSSFLGIENCWINLGLEPEKMIAWFDRYADWLCGLSESLAEAGVDIITLSDDWGSNNNMLFSPKMWRRMIRPYTERVVKHARAQGLWVNLHSDGYIMDVMPDIVEMGYNMLHPLQESAGMDPHTIKQEYGDKVVIYGSLDVVDGLYSHDGEALDDYITKRFEVYAPGGGFIFCSGHFVQPDIPPQRLIRAYTLANKLAEQYPG